MNFFKSFWLRFVALSAFLCTLLPLQAHNDDKAMNLFISKLMQQMTLEEKIGQFNLPVTGNIVTGQAKSSDVARKIKEGKVGGMFNLKGVDQICELQKLAVEKSRLGIPLIFGMDVIHGYETLFPIPLALASTWNMDAIEKSARIAAIECSADGICWTFSPMVDICRDPRWGRIAEGAGEDPFLGGAVSAAMVRGYQGDLSHNDEIMACVKHFALYGAAEAGRDYNTVDMSRNRMFNEYMYPYQAAIDAGVGSVMASFNEVDGIPATGNKFLMTDVLRDMWGFKGFVVTDYTGISEMQTHGMGDEQTVAALAMNAGIDMDMVSEAFLHTLAQSVREGKVSVEAINQACRRMLEAKYRLGLFDNPYKYCVKDRAQKDIFNARNRSLARQIATESFVLMKNEGKILPLQKHGKIAVIGPLADSRKDMPGTWAVAAVKENSVSLLDGIKAAVGDKAEILTAKGCNLMSDPEYEKRAIMFTNGIVRDNRSDKELLEEAISVASQSDVIVAALGESADMNGECSSRSQLEMTDTQHTLMAELIKTGKPVVLVLFTGRPLVLNWEKENIPAILNVWFAGSEAGNAISDVLFGDVNPSGKLTATFPKNVGQIPIFYNHKNTGRPIQKGEWFSKFKSNYLDVDNEPLYPFGYGLSYTDFKYSDIRLDKQTLTMNGNIKATVTITNTGDRKGAEVVQMYIRDLAASITRPVQELKGFNKIELEAGESKDVTFNITPDLLKFYNNDLEYICEPGEFHLMIGTNSAETHQASFTLVK